MTDAKGRDAPGPHPDSDNPVVFPGSETVERLLEIAPGPRARGDVATAWSLVQNIRAKDGADVLLLAVAIGCLCRALTPPGERPGADTEDRP